MQFTDCQPKPTRWPICRCFTCGPAESRRGGSIRPFPKHSLQGGGNILRPGCVGCWTFATPLPSQAGHFISATFRFGLVMCISRKMRSNQIRRHALHRSHAIMQNGLLPPTVPSNSYARPIRFSDGARVGLIVSPANAVADTEGSGLLAGHFHQ